jgi:NADH:flavin oxidoreductase / NADH oxidase family
VAEILEAEREQASIKIGRLRSALASAGWDEDSIVALIAPLNYRGGATRYDRCRDIASFIHEGESPMQDLPTGSTRDLFTPIEVGPLTLPNRIVMAPLTRSRAGPRNVPTALSALY